MISFDEFSKLDIRLGKIISAERVPQTDRLLKLLVDLAEEEPRQVISGIAEYVPDENALVGTTCAFVANLEPKVIKGLESRGMILAAYDAGEGRFSLLVPERGLPPGTKGK